MKKIACAAALLAVAGFSGVASAQSSATTNTVRTDDTYRPAAGDSSVTTTTVQSTTESTDATPVVAPNPNAAAVTGVPPARGNDMVYAYNDNHPYKFPFHGAGIGFLVGGGISNFTASLARESTQAGAGWDATLIFGSRQIIGLEAGYNGSINDINVAGLSGHTKLIGNGATGVARINFTKTAFQPFVIGGLGWKHYSLANNNFNSSFVKQNDNVVEIPMGFGLAYHFKTILVDARGVYKYALNSGLFSKAIADSDSAGDLHNWGARVNVGFEF